MRCARPVPAQPLKPNPIPLQPPLIDVAVVSAVLPFLLVTLSTQPKHRIVPHFPGNRYVCHNLAVRV
jgi:hypothetical protein